MSYVRIALIIYTKHITGMHDLSYERLKALKLYSLQRRREKYCIIYVWKVLEGLVPNFSHPIIATLSDRRGRSCTISNVNVGCKGSGLYSGGLTWSIVLRCDDHTGIFTCDGCTRDPYFHVPAETQSYVIKLSCSRKVLAASGD